MTYLQKVWSRFNINGFWFAKDWIFGTYFNWVIRPWFKYTIYPVLEMIMKPIKWMFNFSNASDMVMGEDIAEITDKSVDLAQTLEASMEVLHNEL